MGANAAPTMDKPNCGTIANDALAAWSVKWVDLNFVSSQVGDPLVTGLRCARGLEKQAGRRSPIAARPIAIVQDVVFGSVSLGIPAGQRRRLIGFI